MDRREKKSNSIYCHHCNKDKRKDFAYYRNGNYFCNKECWYKYEKEKTK